MPNPAWELVAALSTLKDRAGRILIPGFYDDVQPWTDADLAAIAALPNEREEHLRKRLGLTRFLDGVSGQSFKERLYGSPTCTICGFHSGYGGPGVKTVLPATASAKIDFRLVPDQQPTDIFQKLRRHLDAQGLGHVDVRVVADAGLAARTPLDHPMVQRVTAITRDYYGVEPVLIPISPGGVVMEPFVNALGAATMLAGMQPIGGNVHAPNEYVTLDSLAPAIKFNAYLLSRLGED